MSNHPKTNKRFYHVLRNSASCADSNQTSVHNISSVVNTPGTQIRLHLTKVAWFIRFPESWSVAFWVFAIFLLFLTNLATFFFCSWPIKLPQNYSITGFGSSFDFENVQELLMKLNETRRDLVSTEAELHSLKAALATSSEISENVITELAHLMDFVKSQGTNIKNDNAAERAEEEADFGKDIPQELSQVFSHHSLPLGYSMLFGTDKVYAPFGHPCLSMKKDLAKYMSYEPGAFCPEDDKLAQSLMVKGCEPLPRRRCRTRIPQGYIEPHPFPQSMWTIPPDTSILWTPYSCKSYGCLIDRKKQKGVFSDCRDCFDIDGREKSRWLNTTANDINYSIDEVLALKKGGIRIGLDVGGGTGTFAVRMRERNVTIITTSMNFDGPFNNFIASRGVLPMFMTISQRLPFFDNTLDIVHSMHVLSNWIPTTLLELILYDIYRVLRPGGIFWLDRFFCIESQLNEVYEPLFDSLKFNKVRWSVGRKLDRGIEYKEMYISAILEKPMQ